MSTVYLYIFFTYMSVGILNTAEQYYICSLQQHQWEIGTKEKWGKDISFKIEKNPNKIIRKVKEKIDMYKLYCKEEEGNNIDFIYIMPYVN